MKISTCDITRKVSNARHVEVFRSSASAIVSCLYNNPVTVLINDIPLSIYPPIFSALDIIYVDKLKSSVEEFVGKKGTKGFAKAK